MKKGKKLMNKHQSKLGLNSKLQFLFVRELLRCKRLRHESKNLLKKKITGKDFFTLLPLMQSQEQCQPAQSIKRSTSLQKKRNYDNFSDGEEDENNSCTSTKELIAYMQEKNECARKH